MKLKDMRRLSDTELVDQLASAKEELFDLRFQLATRQLKNVQVIPVTKRKIARVLTVMREREMATDA